MTLSATVAKERWDQSTKLFEDAGRILQNKDAAPEEKAKVGEMLEEAKRLRAESNQFKSIMDAAAVQWVDEQKVKAGGQPTPDQSKFERWGHFLEKAHLAMMSGGSNVDPRLKQFIENSQGIQVKDLAEGAGATGGFLVPAEFQATLMAVMGERALIRSRATVVPMRRREVSIPVLDQTGTTTNVPHWFGGIYVEWGEEGQEKPQHDPTFRQVKLVAHKLIGYTRASDELLDDSAIGLEAFLSGPMGFAGAAAWAEDYAFLRGSGAGQPLGVIDAGVTLAAPRASAGNITYEDLVGMLARFLPGGRGVWIASQTVLTELMSMSGPSGNASYIWPALMMNGATEGTPTRLLGYPIIFSEKAPRLGHRGDIGLYDFSYYLVGDRQATTVESTKFDRWRYDQTSWRLVHRVDGQPWLSAPLTYEDGATQVSPFVVLEGQAIS